MARNDSFALQILKRRLEKRWLQLALTVCPCLMLCPFSVPRVDSIVRLRPGINSEKNFKLTVYWNIEANFKANFTYTIWSAS